MLTQLRYRGLARAMATRAVLEKTDRLLGWKDGRVRVVPPGDRKESPNIPPAWTNGKTITINGTASPLFEAFIDGLTPETTMLITALNYHELAHIFFTPRLTSPFVKKIQQRSEFMAFNALEDQAAESRFVRLYNPARHYFTNIIATYMVGRPELIPANYPLISGRKFLPIDLRRLFRQNFALQHRVQEIDEIVNEYCDLVWPKDEMRMGTLITRFQHIINELQSHGMKPDLSSHHGTQDSGVDDNSDHGLTEGSPLTAEEREEIAKMPQVGEDICDTKGSSDPKSDKDGGKGKLPGGKGAGQDTDDVEKWWGPDDLDELTKAAIEDATEQMADEVRDRQEAIKHTESEYRVEDFGTPFDTRSAEPVHTETARKVEDELRKLNQRYKPGWDRRQETGKIDTNQIANIKRGRTDVFKRWHEGINKAVNIEAVLMLDMSGSMHAHLRQSSEAIWMLHRAFKNVDAEVTVLGYTEHTRCHVLLQRGMATPREIRDYHTGGSTWVMPALKEANQIFAVSRRPIQVLFIVTDGAFSDPDQVKNTLKQMTTPTAFVGINYDVSKTWPPTKFDCVKVSRTISQPHELVPFAKQFVVSLVREKWDVRAR